MKRSFAATVSSSEHPIWGEGSNGLVSFDLELTARCNNNCRHCYINLPPRDRVGKRSELSREEVLAIAEEARARGALWCNLTGGEPLLRDDFRDIYLDLKRMGFLIAILTNATLVTKELAGLFRRYPPRDIEVTVYGVTAATYERVTRVMGSFNSFMSGLSLLRENRVKVRLKTMALRSNRGEFEKIARFCRRWTKDYFRWDPFLHLRYDGDPERNATIRSERLSFSEIVEMESSDRERLGALKKDCGKLMRDDSRDQACGHLFRCGAGRLNFTVSPDGLFRLCGPLCRPDCVYDLRRGTLAEAWEKFVPAVRSMRSMRNEYLARCRLCPIINLCMWCPAHAYLETGQMDVPVEYFCSIAHARAEMLEETKGPRA